MCECCFIMLKTVHNYCCQEKAVKYDKYEKMGEICITLLQEYSPNKWTEGVLKDDMSRLGKLAIK